MITIIAGANKVIGNLRNYEFGTDDMTVRLDLVEQLTVDVVFPKVPSVIADTMRTIGLQKLKDSTVDLNTRKVVLNNLKSEGDTMAKGKLLSSDRGSRMKIGSGSFM